MDYVKKAWRDYIPEPPVINFAWLKQWWPKQQHKWPHANNKSGKSRGQLKAETRKVKD